MAIKVKERIYHNNTEYNEGDVIGDGDITEEQEKALVDAGIATTTRGNTKGGTKVKREAAVKNKLKQDTSNRKTVTEKAQARNKTQQAAPAEVEGDVPVETETVDGDGQVTEDADKAKPNVVSEESFDINGDEYTKVEYKSGTVQYRKNGDMIGKLDYLDATKGSK